MRRAILRRNNSFTAMAWVDENNKVTQIDIKVTGYWSSSPIHLRAPIYTDQLTSIEYSSGGHDSKVCTDVERIRHFTRALEWAASIARLMDDGAVVGKERFDIRVEVWLDTETGAENQVDPDPVEEPADIPTIYIKVGGGVIRSIAMGGMGPEPVFNIAIHDEDDDKEGIECELLANNGGELPEDFVYIW